jgi:hypothetical protein
MEHIMKVSGEKIWRKASGHLSIVMGKNIPAAFKKIEHRAMVNIAFLMDPNILANG